MTKESYYFPHDYEPTGDPKIQALIGEYGATGYGIFWRVVEMLHSNAEHKLPFKKYIFLAIAKQLLTSVQQTEAIIQYCINDCELFVSDGEFFWSKRVNTNFERRAQISEIRSNAGKAGAIAKQMLAIAKQNQANTSKGKESKVKENKVKEIKEKEIKEKEIKRAIPPCFDSIEFKECLNNFEIMRNKIRKPLTERAFELLINELKKLSNDDQLIAIKIMERSILNSWQGIFELKNNRPKSNQFEFLEEVKDEQENIH